MLRVKYATMAAMAAAAIRGPEATDTRLAAGAPTIIGRISAVSIAAGTNLSGRRSHAGIERRPVRARYRVLDGARVTIELGDYDRERPLIIDPVLAYSSYFGGSGDDGVRAIAVDASGNIYLTGVTTSTNFPTANAHQGTRSGPNTTTDVFVTKLNPAGTTVFFSTYLGGAGSENNATETAGRITLDGNGNIYVAGDTVSADFPTTGNAFQPAYAGGANNPADGFISKFSATGVLTYSTYFGGVDVDHINGIAIASNGDITFSGRTRSSQVEGLPLVNAIDTTLAEILELTRPLALLLAALLLTVAAA